MNNKTFSKKITAVTLTLCMMLALLPAFELPAKAAVVGAFDVTGGTLGTNYTYANNTLTIISSGTYTIGMESPGAKTMTDRIVVTPGVTATITLNNVSIDMTGKTDRDAFSISSYNTTVNTTVTLTLTGANTLIGSAGGAGIQVPHSAGFENKLVINGTGSLTAQGGYGRAGIGGGSNNSISGTITIDSGTVTATGGEFGAGIGGGVGGSQAGAITINGGTVVASGGYWAAGLGGGSGVEFGAVSGSAGVVNITGGRVTATGGVDSAGIGGGYS